MPETVNVRDAATGAAVPMLVNKAPDNTRDPIGELAVGAGAGSVPVPVQNVIDKAYPVKVPGAIPVALPVVNVTDTPASPGNQACLSVTIQAWDTNTGNLLIGTASAQPLLMRPGAVYSLPCANTNLLRLVRQTTGTTVQAAVIAFTE